MEGRIAYRGTDRQLYICNPDGTGGRLLSPDGFSAVGNGHHAPGREAWPVWSPDANRIAYSRATATIDGGNQLALRMVTLPTGEITSLYVNPAGVPEIGPRIPHYAQWSADGTFISFLVGTERGLALHVASPSKGIAATAAVIGAPLYFAWAPDRSALLLHIGRQQYLFDVEGRVPPAALGVSSAAHRVTCWSPDGGAMAYIAEQDGEPTALYVANRQGKEPRRLIDVRSLAVVTWSPAGGVLALGDGQDNAAPFFPGMKLVRLDGTHVEITQERVLAFFWSPDGRKLAYVTLGTTDTTLSLIVLNLSQQRETLRLEMAPAWGFLTMLPYFDQYAGSHRIWSPDSSALVVPGTFRGSIQGSTPSVFVIDVSGKEPPKPIAEGSMAFWSPR
ncbi:MAG: hypothetical protein EXR67_04140 [Dehalococcoidia bacterium]|nr:hypothetical protein [Dehalococcoidia bacterium]